MRDAFGAALVALGERDSGFVVLDADNAPATRVARFAARWEDRFLNVGCAEQNLVGCAAGIALAGVPVVASTFAAFLCGRAFEQIRNTVCAAGVPVVLVGTHAGVTVGRDGASHFAAEDLALMRSLPGMTVLVASSDEQVGGLLATALAARRPAYLRVSRRPTPARVAPASVRVGGADALRRGDDVSILAAGVMVTRALDAADALATEGIEADVLDLYSVKPLDADAIAASAARTGAVVVAEEHTLHGGLGEAVARLLAARPPVALELVGLPDSFAASGEPDELLDVLGLRAADIAAACRRAIARARAGGGPVSDPAS